MVVGAGRIGHRAIEIGHGFGMEVLACDARPDPAAAKRLGFCYLPLGDLLVRADVVRLHVPGGGS